MRVPVASQAQVYTHAENYDGHEKAKKQPPLCWLALSDWRRHQGQSRNPLPAEESSLAWSLPCWKSTRLINANRG